MFDQDQLLAYLSQYAYQPWLVYLIITVLLTASSFGLPIPEEVTLVSAGLIGHMARNPTVYPPPYEGAQPINVYTLATVCLLAVFLSDFLVYYIGRFSGDKLMKSQRLKKYVTTEAFKKTLHWVEKYGAWMSGVFRFTPGLRFPGHLTCGMLGVPAWKFTAVDGTAALLSVPTQVLLVAFYGDVILEYFKQFKIILIILFVLALAIFLLRKSTWVRGLFKKST